MFFGTILGWLLALMRHSAKPMLRTPGNIGTDLFRNIPSFVFMFYLAFVMPVEFTWDDQIIKIPVWIKAALALTVPVIGFASDQTLRFFKDREEGAGYAVLMFAVAWTQYFIIIIMASSTASVIGVDEIVARANTVITAIREPEFMLWMYLYVALWFLALGIFVATISSLLLKRYGHK
jgi:polar amino acid transport system permease protein